MRLIDYTAQYLSLIDAMSYADTELEQEQVDKMLNDIEQGREEKLESCAWVYREYIGEQMALGHEIERLKNKLLRAERNGERLKNYIGYCLQGESIKTKTFDFRFRKSKQVIITGEVPDQYLRVKTVKEPDKILLKQDLEGGANLEFARLQENLNLTIK